MYDTETESLPHAAAAMPRAGGLKRVTEDTLPESLERHGSQIHELLGAISDLEVRLISVSRPEVSEASSKVGGNEKSPMLIDQVRQATMLVDAATYRIRSITKRLQL